MSTREEVQEICDRHEVGVAFINITATQLKKSIMDATKPVRELLLSEGIHDYGTQAQGSDSKVTIDVHYMEEETLTGEDVTTNDTASLYRPTSGNGDPRIWFTNLKKYVEAGDVLAVVVGFQVLYVFNVKNTLELETYLDEEYARMVSKVGV